MRAGAARADGRGRRAERATGMQNSAGTRTPIPAELRYRLAELILAESARAGLGPGSRLPTERKLAADMGATRTSIRHALAVLQAQGHISREVGRGTFLRPDPDTRRARQRPGRDAHAGRAAARALARRQRPGDRPGGRGAGRLRAGRRDDEPQAARTPRDAARRGVGDRQRLPGDGPLRGGRGPGGQLRRVRELGSGAAPHDHGGQPQPAARGSSTRSSRTPGTAIPGATSSGAARHGSAARSTRLTTPNWSPRSGPGTATARPRRCARTCPASITICSARARSPAAAGRAGAAAGSPGAAPASGRSHPAPALTRHPRGPPASGLLPGHAVEGPPGPAGLRRAQYPPPPP